LIVPDDLSRYHRQMLLSGVGEAGQRRLLGAHAVIVGVGALGTVAADLLARAGVGRLTLIDRDVVELTNLQRQTLFTERDAREGRPKAVAAAERLREVNSLIRIEPVPTDLDGAHALDLLTSAPLGAPDVVLDGTDNFLTRYILNDACVRMGVPLVYAGAVGWGGSQMTVVPGETACLRCIRPEPPGAGETATCDSAGVFAPVSAIVAAAQAADALRLLLGLREAGSGTLLSFDLQAGRRSRLNAASLRDPDCPCCAHGRFEFLDGSRDDGAGATLCGRLAVQVKPTAGAGAGAGRVDLEALAARLRAHGSFTASPHLLRGKLHETPGGFEGACELTVFADGRAIVGGTARADLARSVYARYVGA